MAYRRRYKGGPRVLQRNRPKPTWTLDTWRNYSPPESRRQERCPRCGMSTGVFFCRLNRERAWYYCANVICSARFDRAYPEPMEVA